MLTAKSRLAALDVPQKPSLTKSRPRRNVNTPGSSPIPPRKAPKGSPKVVDRRSPRSPATEKKHSRISDCKSRNEQLVAELKKTKDELNSSESYKKRAQQEAEEYKKQLVAIETRLESTNKQLKDLSDCEETKIHELRKVSHDRDRAWQSEIEALQKQHSLDTTALASALSEIKRLKIQLDMVVESEASRAESARNEVRSLRLELTKAREFVEKLKELIIDSRESEARAFEEQCSAQILLEVTKTNEETLKSGNANVVKSYESLLLELEYSKNKMELLKEVVDVHQSKTIKTELDEPRYEDQCLCATDHAKAEYDKRVAEFEAKLEEYKSEVDILKTGILKNENAIAVHCENELTQKILAERETELELELKKLESVLDNLKTSLLDKEARLRAIANENEILKSEIMKTKVSTEQETARLAEEVDKSRAKATRANEQLSVVQTANSEMESELRKLKVQSDQWRKAAETAAALLWNGKYVERRGSFDYDTISVMFGDVNDNWLKKKNGNVLKKIGVLLKKGQK